MISFILNMVSQKVTDLSFDEAKQHTKIITGIINEFLDSVEQIFPGIGYGDMAESLKSLQSEINSSSKPFLSSIKINEYTSALFDAFTTMNPDLENNLQKLFNSYKEIGNFIFENHSDIPFTLLDFKNSRVDDIKANNHDLMQIIPKLKKVNYEDVSLLRGLFSIFTSIVETSEELHREALLEFRNKLNEYAKNHDLSYTFPFDPVDVFSIGDAVIRKNDKYYTKQRALRNLIGHHHYKINSSDNTIEFKNPDDPQWQFDFDETMTFKVFCDYVGTVDAFYKSAVSLMLTFSLLGYLRTHFQDTVSIKTKLQLQNLLFHMNQHSYFSK